MARSMFPDVEISLREDGWVVDRSFLPYPIGDGMFLVQTRRPGSVLDDTYTSILESFNDLIPTGRC